MSNYAREDSMLTVIKTPTVIEAVGTKPKRIEEYVGRVNSDTEALSIAKMMSPASCGRNRNKSRNLTSILSVLSGMLRLQTADGIQDVCAGQAVIAPAGQWVRYSTPEDGGAEYVAICLPAFSRQRSARDS